MAGCPGSNGSTIGTNAAVPPDAAAVGEAVLPEGAAVGPGADEELELEPPQAARVPIRTAETAALTSTEGFAGRTPPDPHFCRIRATSPVPRAPYLSLDPR
jgi:hypothetical protein